MKVEPQGAAAGPPGELLPDPTAVSGNPELIEHYDRQYASGGFGYERQRDTWVAWVAEHYIQEFDLRAGERLLDVGCGDGFWTAIFADAGLVATGVDLSPGGIDVARREHPTVEFVVDDAESLRFPDETFDIVFCRAISHLSRRDLFTDASARLVAGMVRVLRPGGLILLSFYTRRDGGGTPEHAWHRSSDLLKLIEPVADPIHLDVVGHYVQIGAQRRDAPRRPRRRHLGSSVTSAKPILVRRILGRARRTMSRLRT